ncbi:unnamed protein product [Boreogadus saida]
MSAREKATGTKDSVSLLPCFYFVEVRDGSCSPSSSAPLIRTHLQSGEKKQCVPRQKMGGGAGSPWRIMY